MKLPRIIFSELKSPYAYAGIVMLLGLLLLAGGLLYRAGEWIVGVLG